MLLIVVTEEGIVIDSSDVQLENELALIDVTEEGIVIDLSDAHL